MGSGRRRSGTPTTAGVALLLLVAALVAAVAAGKPEEGAVFAVLAGAPTLLGLRIDRALPHHGMGLRLTLVGAALALMGLVDVLRYVDDRASELTAWASVANDVSFVPALAAIAGVLVAFPDGHAPAGRYRSAERAVLALLAVALVAMLLRNEAFELDDRTVPSPLPVVPGAAVIAAIGVFCLLGWLVASFAALRGRHRRATGVERLQLRWLAYGGATVPVAMAICVAGALLGGDEDVVTLSFLVPVVVLPAAVTISVLRYRLYEIDRLVNRTLVYTALTAVLAAVYAAVTLALGTTLGGGSPVAVAVATLAVASVAGPAHRALQTQVDRRFARRRYDGMRRVTAFLEDVRLGRSEPEAVGTVLADALGDRSLEVYFRLPATGGYADAAGRLVPLPDDDLRARTPVTRNGLELGLVLHDPGLARTPDTLDGVLRATGLAFELARLRVELRVQLAEVEASRDRLLGAAEAERRKLERDLHDGAQQRLVALGLALRHVQHQVVEEDRDGALQTIDEAVDQLTTAVAELRAIARGLRPSLLDAGLGPALAEVAARSPLPVVVEVAPGTGLPPAVETTAYFLACEALTNAVKHAGASKVRVRVDHGPGGVRVEVADDGTGGAKLEPGGGLVGMRERAAAVGGTIEVASARGRGTRIIADLPWAS